MRLVSFDLDLPYIENEENIISIINMKGCERNEATRQDYEENWKWKRREFALQTRCITSFYERLFGYINTNDCKKLIIKCIPIIHDNAIRKFSGGYYEVVTQLCYDLFAKLSDYDKKKMSLELLMTGVRHAAYSQNWDIAPFENTYLKILDAEYKNEWIWKKSVKSPNKQAIAYVLLQHEVKCIDIYIVISDKKGNEVFRKKIMTEVPDEWIYAQHLGEIKWIDDNKVALINKNNDNNWSVVYH